jgi:hypothetical protein
MPQEKKAAIDLDALGDKSLNEVSAEDFLTALNAGGLTLQHLTVWPEKKKVELYVEPENLGKVHLKDIIVVVRVEKKKVELEKNPGFENWRDPRDFLYDDLLNRLTRDIESRLRMSR